MRNVRRGQLHPLQRLDHGIALLCKVNTKLQKGKAGSNLRLLYDLLQHLSLGKVWDLPDHQTEAWAILRLEE